MLTIYKKTVKDKEVSTKKYLKKYICKFLF